MIWLEEFPVQCSFHKLIIATALQTALLVSAGADECNCSILELIWERAALVGQRSSHTEAVRAAPVADNFQEYCHDN